MQLQTNVQGEQKDKWHLVEEKKESCMENFTEEEGWAGKA